MRRQILSFCAPTLFLIVSFLFFGCNSNHTQNKFSDPELVKIADFADYHSTDSLVKYLNHKQPLLRVECAYALASVRDPKAIDALHTALKDPVAQVREAAAYAIGQILHPSSVEPLSLQLNRENDAATSIAIAEALGKIGGAFHAASTAPEWTENVVNALSNMERSDSIGIHAFAKGAFWLHNGGWSNPQLMNKLAAHYASQSILNRRMIVYAMARYRGDWYEDSLQVNRFLSNLQKEQDPLTLTVGISIAGRIESRLAISIIKSVLASENASFKQLISACRAAANNTKVEAKALLPLLQHSHPLVTEEALIALKNKSLDSDDLDYIRSSALKMPIPLEAVAAQLLHAHGDTLGVHEWLKKIKQTKETYERIACIRTLGVSGNSAEICLKEALNNSNILEANAFTEAFIASHENPDFPLTVDFIGALIQLINRNDVGITALCSAELRRLKPTIAEKAIINETLLNALNSLILPMEVETANEIIKTLNVVGITPREEIKPSFNNPINWELVKSIPRRQRANIHTSKGTIQIQLHVEEAPGSVASFVILCREGFYNGKSFHRVVPNFVAQGGCPRGDGMGGTNYTLRSEFRLHDYSTGSVGLASAGPDTESCQWFITLLPTPHLEGRYALFAHVTKGLEVAESIVIGDRIERIELIEE